MRIWYLTPLMIFAGVSAPTALTMETPFEMRSLTALGAAEKMRGSFKNLVSSENFALLGFRSVKEVEFAALGAPLTRIRLRSDSILNYTPSKGENLETMVFSRSKIFPLLVDLHARSTILVDSSSLRGGLSQLYWEAHELGNRSLAEIIDKSLPRLAAQTRLPASAFTLVEIPATGQRYLAFQTSQGGYLALADRNPYAGRIRMGIQSALPPP